MTTLVMFWLILAVALAVLELVTAPLICIWFCGGALFGALTGYLTNSVWASALVFVLASGILLALTRPLVKNKLAPKTQPTNADRIIGKEAIVILDINPDKNTGQIMVDGQVWSAKSSCPIKEGERVLISEIQGVKAVVAQMSAVTN